MADRYWVGGTATWDGTAGTKWALTSGGAGGQAVPTATDDVYFDASSGANTVTISGTRPCLSLNATGFTGTLAGTSTPILQINASLTLASGMTIDGTLTNVNFVGNTATRTLTSSGKSLINVTVATTSTNTLTLQDDLTVTTNFTFTTGVLALDTRTLTTATFTNTSTSTRTLNFGTGKLALTGSGTVFNGVITGFTTSGTTKIVEPSLGAAQTITPGALTEANAFDISVPATAGNFTLTLTAGGYHDLTFANATYTVANTALSVYGNLSIAGTSPTFTAGTNAWTFASASSTQTVTTNGETLDFPITINGANTTFQLQDALTVASGRTVTLTDGTIDLQSYTFTTGLFSSSNANSRTIAFGTGKIVLTGTGTVWTTSTVTSLTTSGSKVVEPALQAAQTITPGAILEANAFDLVVPATAGNFTLTLTAGNFRNLSFDNATYTVANTALTIYGNLLVSGTSPTFTAGTNAWTFASAAGTQQITTNGETLDFPITINGASNTFQLQDALTIGPTRTLTLTDGTLDLQSYTLTLGLFSSSNSNTRTIAFGTGKMVFNGTVTATSWTTSTVTNLTITGSRDVESTAPIAANTKTFTFGAIPEASAFNFTVITGGSTGIVAPGGNVNNLTLQNDSYTFTPGTLSVFGNLLVSGTSPVFTSSSTVTMAATSGTKTITTNGDSIDAPIQISGAGGTFQIEDALTIGATRQFTFTNGTLNLQSYTLSTGIFSSSNSNSRTLNFGTGKIVLTNTATNTVFSTSTATNFVTTGTKLVEILKNGTTPTKTISCGATTEANALDFTIVDAGGGANVFSFGGNTNNITCPNITCTMQVGSSTWNIYGNLSLGGTSVSWTTASSVNVAVFAATSGTKTVTTNGVTLNSAITFNGVGGTWELGSALTVGTTRVLTLTNGTLSLNNYSCSTGQFQSNTGTRTLNFGTEKITLTNSDGTTNYILTLGAPSTYTVTGQNEFLFAMTQSTASSAISMSSGWPEDKAPDVTINSASQFKIFGEISVGTLKLLSNSNIKLEVASGSTDIFIYKNFTIDPGFTGSIQGYNSGGTVYNLRLRFASTSATVRSIDTQNNNSLEAILYFDGSGGSWRFDANFSHSGQIDPNNAEKNIQLIRGSVNLNGYAIKTNAFLSSASNTRTLTFGASTLELMGSDTTYAPPSTAAFYVNSSNLTINKDTGVISFSAGTTKTFDGGGSSISFPTLKNSGGSELVIKNSFGGTPSINDLQTFDANDTIFGFPIGTTTRFDNFTLTPIVGRRSTIQTAGAGGNTHDLVLLSGIANCQRLNISYSNASPGTNTWYAGSTSLDNGNNTGWIFQNAPQASGNMLMLFA
jgi:hypothetical protein